jgi:hypothetical protein
MSPLLVSLIVFACVYGGALLGFSVRIPGQQRDLDSREVLKAATGLVATMAALVLGLLVASAKNSYDNQRDQLIQICADVSLLDRALAQYGPEGAATRERLRSTVEKGFVELWRSGAQAPSAEGEALYDAIDRLPAESEEQRSIKSMTTELAIGLGKTRWLMHAQSGTAISTPLLVVVVFWLTILFVSFGVYATPNATVHVALFVCALSVAAAVFLILEMDRPFDGLIRISDAPLRDVVSRLGKD